jgi:hypothetical protein
VTAQDVADEQAAKLRARIREDVAGWPPLTDDQRTRLAILLAPASVDGQQAGTQ